MESNLIVFKHIGCHYLILTSIERTKAVFSAAMEGPYTQGTCLKHAKTRLRLLIKYMKVKAPAHGIEAHWGGDV
jgi:hypothetical protein